MHDSRQLKGKQNLVPFSLLVPIFFHRKFCWDTAQKHLVQKLVEGVLAVGTCSHQIPIQLGSPMLGSGPENTFGL
eukprot:3395164-Rhodomonas_salina.1